MKYDEFAFFNQQLAAMLRENIPLEGALRQLCRNLGRGQLRSEIELLETDLSKGTSLKTALAARKLPEFYVQMVEAGVAANDLPGVLVMLADYYQRANLIWMRLKGLLVYPLLVLCAAFVLSGFITVFGLRLLDNAGEALLGGPVSPSVFVSLWVPPIMIGIALVVVGVVMATPLFRRQVRWRLPAFREANLAQTAGALGLVLQRGGNLGDAINLVRHLEKGTPAARELEAWHARLASGHGRFAEIALPGVAFPPLFVWLVASSGENLAAGFRRAAEIYGARAAHKTEMILFAALPCSIVILGTMIVGQIFPVARVLTTLLNGIGGP